MPLIRAAQELDFVDILQIQSSPKVILGTMQIPHFNRLTETRFKSKLTDPNYYPFVASVSETNRRALGFSALEKSSSPRLCHCGHIFLVVGDEHQGKGIGTLLLKSMIELADNWLNLIRLDLTVFVDNDPAIHLYKKFGFEIEGTQRKKAFRDGKFADVHMMARIK